MKSRTTSSPYVLPRSCGSDLGWEESLRHWTSVRSFWMWGGSDVSSRYDVSSSLSALRLLKFDEPMIVAAMPFLNPQTPIN